VKEYLIVDGYNIINAWPEFGKNARNNLENARRDLIEMMMEYQGLTGLQLIVVFDAYLGKNPERHEELHGPVLCVFTKKGETADSYIEKLVFTLGKDYPVRVATSDGLQQHMILGSGGYRYSAREFREDFFSLKEQVRKHYLEPAKREENMGGTLLDRLNGDTAELLERWRRSEE